MYETDVPVSDPQLQPINEDLYKKMNEQSKTKDDFYNYHEQKIKEDFNGM